MRRAAPLAAGSRALLACVGLLLTLSTWADRGEHHRGRVTAPVLGAPPAYPSECGSCHLAYPAQLLPAASWQRLMQNLPRHYGSDASLDPALAASLQTWLVANADANADRRHQADAAAPPEDRITRSGWFLREHRELPAATWKRPAVVSAANCSACHAGAEQGDFNEHAVRIPR